MRAALLGLLLVGCSASAAPIASATLPVQSPAPVIATAAPSPSSSPFNRLSFTVRFVEADDLAAGLPPAWREATRGLSAVTVAQDGQIPVEVREEIGVSMLDGPPARVILYRKHATGRPLDEYVLMHELGHLLGCCRGVDTNSEGHFIGEPVGLMSASGCRCPFTDRELRAMGLLP